MTKIAAQDNHRYGCQRIIIGTFVLKEQSSQSEIAALLNGWRLIHKVIASGTTRETGEQSPELSYLIGATIRVGGPLSRYTVFEACHLERMFTLGNYICNFRTDNLRSRRYTKKDTWTSPHIPYRGNTSLFGNVSFQNSIHQ